MEISGTSREKITLSKDGKINWNAVFLDATPLEKAKKSFRKDLGLIFCCYNLKKLEKVDNESVRGNLKFHDSKIIKTLRESLDQQGFEENTSPNQEFALALKYLYGKGKVRCEFSSWDNMEKIQYKSQVLVEGKSTQKGRMAKITSDFQDIGLLEQSIFKVKEWSQGCNETLSIAFARNRNDEIFAYTPEHAAEAQPQAAHRRSPPGRSGR